MDRQYHNCFGAPTRLFSCVKIRSEQLVRMEEFAGWEEPPMDSWKPSSSPALIAGTSGSG